MMTEIVEEEDHSKRLNNTPYKAITYQPMIFIVERWKQKQIRLAIGLTAQCRHLLIGVKEEVRRSKLLYATNSTIVYGKIFSLNIEENKQMALDKWNTKELVPSNRAMQKYTFYYKNI